MRQKINAVVSIMAGMALFLSACGAAVPTPDASAISTAAAQTVEARFTEQAAAFTATPLPPTETTIPASTPTQGNQPTEITAPGQPTPTSNGKPCYAMTFVSDITIPDGMILAPGKTFTKTWRVRNDGNCPWDQKYSLELDKGDALGTVTKVALERVVNPGDTIDLSIDMTAPTIEGDYAGYWHVLTPFGGYMGVGTYNQSLLVKIKVSSRPDREFGAVSVVYDWTRRPVTGCGKDGAYYDFRATITANGAGELDYRWDRSPFDGVIEGGTLKFAAAGAKTVAWTWHMTLDHPQGMDRWVSITTLVGSKETYFDRITFNYSCNP